MCICTYAYNIYISVAAIRIMITFWIYWILLQSLLPVLILILILEVLILHVCNIEYC